MTLSSSSWRVPPKQPREALTETCVETVVVRAAHQHPPTPESAWMGHDHRRVPHNRRSMHPGPPVPAAVASSRAFSASSGATVARPVAKCLLQARRPKRRRSDTRVMEHARSRRLQTIASKFRPRPGKRRWGPSRTTRNGASTNSGKGPRLSTGYLMPTCMHAYIRTIMPQAYWRGKHGRKLV